MSKLHSSENIIIKHSNVKSVLDIEENSLEMFLSGLIYKNNVTNILRSREIGNNKSKFIKKKFIIMGNDCITKMESN